MAEKEERGRETETEGMNGGREKAKKERKNSWEINWGRGGQNSGLERTD